MPPADSTTQKFLPSFPVNPILGNHFVQINQNGNFVVNDERIRFWGGNLAAEGAFPAKNKASDIAGRMRKLGFNLMRFHHMDNPWSSGSLFYQTPNTRTFNVTNLDKYEYLFSKLKENGIYSNINLHVGRTFRISDGVAAADSLPEFGKGVTFFDRQLIELQKEYANQLLTHINPYTGLSLINDPAMAMVEITNENSLFRMWHDGKLKPINNGGILTYKHNKLLDSLWNNFLLTKYGTTLQLSNYWNQGTIPAGTLNKIINNDFESLPITTAWFLELHNGAAGYVTRDIINPYAGLLSAKIAVTNGTGTAWHCQWRQSNLIFKKDSTYVIKFAARSDNYKTINVGLMNGDDPYTYYGGKEISLNTQWQIYTINVKCSEDVITNGRLTFQFPEIGTYWFDEISLKTASIDGLLENESLEFLNIKRNDYKDLVGFTINRTKDISEFYLKVEDDYFSEMKDYLKNTLGVKVPIVGTNWNIGAQDLIVQSKLDYLDNHAYWEHPSFPNIPWSSTDWFIANTSMTKSAENSTISSLFSGSKFKGKPYTISEYNHPFPNRFQCEGPIFLSAYSSFHDADGIMFYDYNDSFDWETDKITGYFNIQRNSVFMALNPTMAFLFRNYLVSPSTEKIYLNYSKEDILKIPSIDNNYWSGYSFFDSKIAFLHGVETESFESLTSTDFNLLNTGNPSTYKTDTEQIIFNTNGLLTIKTPQYIGITGYLNNFTNINLGSMTIVNSSDFGAVTWLSLTKDSLSVSNKSLLTIISKVQNTNMIWSGTTSINNNWGTSPTKLSSNIISFKLNINADSIIVYPLSPIGELNNSTKFKIFPANQNIYEFVIDQNIFNTPWFGIEAFGAGVSGIINTEPEIIEHFNLYQNYPNPFNNSTTFNFTIKEQCFVKITIFDILGNRIKTLVNDNYNTGNYSTQWNSTNDKNEYVAGGIYFVTLKTPTYSKTIKSILLK
ncbi:MAG: carbohydrate binding domain-containing protein [bacterium]